MTQQIDASVVGAGERRPRFRWAAALATVAVASGAALWAAWPAAAATVVHVSPGHSIQAAIDAATGPETILIDPGTYHESLLIQKNGITLQGGGAEPNDTVLLPPTSGAPNLCTQFQGAVSGICVLAKAFDNQGNPTTPVNDVTIKGLKVSGFQLEGIFAFGADGITVRDTALTNNGDYGVFSLVSTDITYVDNRASGSGEAGFYVGDSPNAEAVETNNTSSGNQFGFFFRESHHGTLSGNTATGNCAGIVVLDAGGTTGAGDVTIRDNKGSANDRFCPAVPPPSMEAHPPISGNGIALIGAVRTTVADNNVFNNVNTSTTASPFSAGILVITAAPFGGADPSNDTIKNNEMSGNQPDDIVWDGTGTGNSFVANQCHTSVPGGLC